MSGPDLVQEGREQPELPHSRRSLQPTMGRCWRKVGHGAVQNSRTVEQQYRTIFAATRTMRRKAESCRSENARRGHHVLGSPGFLHERQQLVLVFSQKTGSRVDYNLTLHSRVSDALSHLSLWTAAAIRGLLSLPWSLKNAVTVGWWEDGGQAY